MNETGADHADPGTPDDLHCSDHPAVGLSDGYRGHLPGFCGSNGRELIRSQEESRKSAPGTSGDDLSWRDGDLLELANLADPVDVIWTITRYRRHEDGGMNTVWCSLRPIEAKSENEAWGRLWSKLLTAGITPSINGATLSWTEFDEHGTEAHFDIGLFNNDPARGPQRSAGHSQTVRHSDWSSPVFRPGGFQPEPLTDIHLSRKDHS